MDWRLGRRNPQPNFFHDTITGERYLNMLNDDLLQLLLELPEFNERRLIRQKDGAPPHWYRPARMWLDHHFQQRWIGRNGPTAWPPRRPDLTACDFWLWGHVKRLFTSRTNLKAFMISKQEFDSHFKKSLTNKDCVPLRTSIAECDFVIEKVATLSREKLAVLFASLFSFPSVHFLFTIRACWSVFIKDLIN